MSAIDRSTIIRGPAIVAYNSITMYVKDAIKVAMKTITFDKMTSSYGKVDEALSEIMYEITFTPAGKWTGLSTLWPHTTPSIGSSIFGATDKNLTIQTHAGQLLTFKAAAVTKMPDILLSATKTLIGPVTFTAIGANNTAWTDTAKRTIVAANAFADTSFAPADLVTQAYTVAWGAASPFDSMNTEDGVVISPSMTTKAVLTDDQGTVDMTLENVEVSAKFTPVGISETNLQTFMKQQGATVLRGASLGTINAAAFNVSGTGVYVRIYNASPKNGTIQFDKALNRIGEVELVGTAQFSVGVRQPLFYVGTASP